MSTITPNCVDMDAKVAKSRELIQKRVTPPTFDAWVKCGEQIVSGTGNTETTKRCYFEMSPTVQTLLAANQFEEWVKCVALLNARYNDLVEAFIKNSAKGVVPPRFIGEWMEEIKQIHDIDSKTRITAKLTLEATSAMLEFINSNALINFCNLLKVVLREDLKTGDTLFNCAMSNFKVMGQHFATLTDIARFAANKTPKYAAELFVLVTSICNTQNKDTQQQLLALIERLQSDKRFKITRTVKTLGQMCRLLTRQEIKHGLTMANDLTRYSPRAAANYVEAVVKLSGELSFPQIRHWYLAGVADLVVQKDDLTNYFNLNLKTSRQLAQSWRSVVILDEIKDVLELYSQAIANRSLTIAPAEPNTNIDDKWLGAISSNTSLDHISLPPMVKQTTDNSLNFSIYKLASTHQASHYSYGTFEFQFERPSNRLRDLRCDVDLFRRNERGNEMAQFAKLMSLFGELNLAKDIFKISENLRIDSKIQTNYQGLRCEYATVNQAILATRPAVDNMHARSMVLEAMIRYALDQKAVRVPQGSSQKAINILRLLELLKAQNTSIELVAEVVCRIYVLLRQTPAGGRAQGQLEEITADDVLKYPYRESPDDYKMYLESLREQLPDNGTERIDEDEQTKQMPQVDFDTIIHWGDVDPEKMEALILNQQKAKQKQTEAASSEDVVDGDNLQANQDEANIVELKQTDTVNDNIQQAADMDSDGDEEQAEDTPGLFQYDEWDFYVSDYKQDWCSVYEQSMKAADDVFYKMIVRDYGKLFGQIKRQFELLSPDLHAKRKGFTDGEDMDLDAMIGATIDLRCNLIPDDKIYWRRNKRERSIAVAFLIDISASTAESIQINELANHRINRYAKHSKTILDLEKEGVALMARALEMLGDTFGIYAFSGYGHKNVEVSVIKELTGRQYDLVDVISRLGSVVPSHATRMGAAIRHINAKLMRCEEKTKLLFLISDGRPQDKGYSRDGTDRKYAVHDTRMAFMEASAQGIVPFCLTVDKEGNSYLGEMMSDFGYEILDEISELPQRLPQLYQMLTI